MKAFDLFKLGNQVRRLSLYQQTKNRRSIINITTVCNRHSSSFAISTSSSNYPHLKHRKTSICLGGIGIPNIPHISSTTQRKSFSTSFSSTESLITLPPPNSIDLLSLIPQSTLQTIKTLPEVEQTLSSLQSNSNSKLISSPNNKNILDGLERAIQIFQHVGETEYKSILLLKATFLSQCCQYDKAIKVLSSLLVLPENENKNGNGVGSAKDPKEEDTFTFVITSCLIKMHWLNGSVPEGLEYAKIMNDMANLSSLSSLSSSPSSPSSPLMASFKQGCAMNALALCQLLNDKKNQLKDIDIVRIKKSRNNHDNDQLQDDIVDLHINQTNVLKMASEMLENSYNSSLVSSLSSANDADCANSNIISTKLGLACASSYCNQGVMELICNIMQNKTKNGNSDSDSKSDNNDENGTDSAMKMWKKGIDILDKLEKHNQEDNLKKQNNSSSMRHIYICKAIKARMYCNMAWTILFQSSYMNDANDNHEIHTQQPLKEDDLKEASEYATLALKLNDELMILGEDSDNDKDNRKSSDSLKQMTGRALGLVASCYARAGSAVTAEGLLQSAMDLCKQNNANSNDGHGMNIVNQCPMAQIDSRSIFLYYASLCSNWDKREPDAKKNEEFALGVNEKGLSESWKGVSAIYSGLWFFTVSDF